MEILAIFLCFLLATTKKFRNGSDHKEIQKRQRPQRSLEQVTFLQCHVAIPATWMAPMRRFPSLCLVILLATAPGFIKGDTCFTCGRQEIAVPSYVYPCSGSAGCAWDVFKAGASIVIINPNSGPGTAVISDYVNLVTSVKQNSTVTTVLGYVYTNYGIRNTSQVLSDIDAYYQFYPKIDGIFLDEGSTNCDNTNLTNYKSYDARVKSKDSLGFTVLNWGTVGSECYLINTTIDTYCTFEDNYNIYMSAAANRPGWVSNYDPSAFWNIVHSAPNNKTSVQAAVSLAKTRHVGYFYITDAIYNTPVDNPYNVSPSTTTWKAEVARAKLRV